MSVHTCGQGDDNCQACYEDSHAEPPAETGAAPTDPRPTNPASLTFSACLDDEGDVVVQFHAKGLSGAGHGKTLAEALDVLRDGVDLAEKDGWNAVEALRAASSAPQSSEGTGAAPTDRLRNVEGQLLQALSVLDKYAAQESREQKARGFVTTALNELRAASSAPTPTPTMESDLCHRLSAYRDGAIGGEAIVSLNTVELDMLIKALRAIPTPGPTLDFFREMHMAFNVAARREGAVLPACDGPDCSICEALRAASSPAQKDSE